jgi:hypothetical protein
MSTKAERKARMDALEAGVREARMDLSSCEALTNIDGFTQTLMDLAYEASEIAGDPEFTDKQADRASDLEDALNTASEASEAMSEAYTTAHLALSEVLGR